jgi:hypothetical protein
MVKHPFYGAKESILILLEANRQKIDENFLRSTTLSKASITDIEMFFVYVHGVVITKTKFVLSSHIINDSNLGMTVLT